MRSSIWRWTKFSAVGSIGMAVHLGLLALFVKVFGMHYLLATGLAVETAVLHNFVWHCRWTWADRPVEGSAALAATLLRFHLSNGLVSLAGNLFFMQLFAGMMEIDPFVASLLSIPPCALMNFLVSDRWVFHAPAAGLHFAVRRETGGETSN
jgi:dolichol-phosphate mannosyltransferase